jgi:hypothetical protein
MIAWASVVRAGAIALCEVGWVRSRIIESRVLKSHNQSSKRAGFMNISLELPSDLENELSTEASRLNLPLTEYVLRILSLRPDLENPPKTGVELITYWEKAGVINSRPDILNSQDHARQIRHQAETRERA